MKLFDSHSHLHFPLFDADRAEVLARMQEREVGSVLIGTDFATSRQAVELAEEYGFLWAAVGLHPNDNLEETFDDSFFGELAKDPKVVAIGECGLDYFRLKRDKRESDSHLRARDENMGVSGPYFRSGSTPEEKQQQKERFLKQMYLAHEVGKALVIHCREAHEDMLAIFTEEKPTVPVIMHFFTGSGELAQKYLDLGCYLSFPGSVTYTDMYDDSIRVTPMDKILVETDAPFAAPVPHRGKRNEPIFVEEVVKKIAAMKGKSEGEVAQATVQNAQKAFNLQ